MDRAGGGTVRLLGRSRPFRLLWTARSLSFLGDSLTLVALLLHVAEGTGQALAVALLLLVGDFAPALLGPLTGTVADRWEPRRVLVACELAQAVLVVLLALSVSVPGGPLAVLLVLVGLRAVAGQVFQPASRALVPKLVEDRDLGPANAAIGLGTNGGEALGPLLAAALLPVLGTAGVLLVDAGTSLVAVALLVRLPHTAAPGPAEKPTSLLADARDGLRYLAGNRALRAVAIGFVGVVACTGVDDVALVFLATDTFDGGPASVGVLLAAVGVGLLAGYALLARMPGWVPVLVLLLAGFAVSSAGNLLTGLAWAVTAAFAVQAVRGLGVAAMDVAVTTFVQRTVPPALLGRTFGTLYGAVGAAAGASYVVGGLVLDVTSPRTVLVAAGAAGLLVTLGTAWALRGELTARSARRGTRRSGPRP